MLLRLEIRDFAVISNMVFEPGYGLNVISGETGAGKMLPRPPSTTKTSTLMDWLKVNCVGTTVEEFNP